ncbi:MAG: hypothetical protein ABIG28_00550 [archaeon]
MKEKGEQVLVLVVSVAILFGILFLVDFGLTGFVVFGDDTQGEFDLGSYVNTFYNGSGIVLVGSNLTGSYDSQIFDAGGDASWNNLSWSGSFGSAEFLFGVDAQADVWGSSDGTTWSLVKEDYNGGDGNGAAGLVKDSSGNLFVLYKQDVWVSGDGGISWTKVNDDFNGAGDTQSGLVLGIDESDRLFTLESNEDVWRSDDLGVNFAKVNESFNGGSPSAVGIASVGSSLFVVMANAGVWGSSDAGVSWTEMNSDYNGGDSNDANGMTSNSSGSLFILYGKDVWISDDSGVSWTKVNDDFGEGGSALGKTIYIDGRDYVYVSDGDQDVYRSTDSGVSFFLLASNINGANGIVQGMSSSSSSGDLSFEVRNCSSSDCSDGVFVDVDLIDLGLSGQYFQYKVDFTSPLAGVSPILESVDVDYTLSNNAPTMALVKPSGGDSYGYNESIPLEFSASDADGDLDSCWYTLDLGETNTSIADCDNMTFDVAEGSSTLTIYVNDSFGESASDSASFSVAVGAPTIVLVSPIDVYLNDGEVIFRYIPTDVDLDSCQLWGDFTGTFELNQTDTGVVSGSESIFSLNLEDGIYLWNVLCNDSLGNSAMNGNKTFYVDTGNPGVVLTQPTGTKTSLAVMAEFVVSDSFNISYCYYNVSDVNGAILVSNTRIANCSTTNSLNFVLGGDEANAMFRLWANDSAGNSNFSNLSFSVDTSTPLPPSNPPSGGGSSGGSSAVGSSFELGLSGLKDIFLKRGKSDKINLEVVNEGKGFLNDCNLNFGGSAGSWLSSSGNKGLAAGEKFIFEIVLDIPASAEPGEYGAGIFVDCDEGNESANISIVTYRNTFEIEIGNYERDGNTLRVGYSLKEYSGGVHEIVIDYSLLDFDGVPRYNSQVEESLGAREDKEGVIEFGLPKDSFGEFIFRVELSDGISKISSEKEVFLPSQKGLTGIVVSDEKGIRFSIAGVVAAVLLLGFFVFLIFRRFKKKVKKIGKGQRGKRKFIELEL